MKVYVAAIGLSGPGWSDWASALPALRGEAAYVPAAHRPSGRSPLIGPERRRATAITRMALEAAMEAAGPERAAWDLPTVFASSGGEVDTCDILFDQLARPERMVSPTQFHNSVHNTASGYWGIASGSHQPSSSVACFDATFAAGLVEAAAVIAADGCEVLLIAYDGPPPFPIAPFRPLLAPFAVALRLSPNAKPTGTVRLEIAFDTERAAAPTAMSDLGLEALRLGNPAARALPVLAAIARRESTTVVIEAAGAATLRVAIAPCT